MRERVTTQYIAIHCSATPPSLDVGEEWIRALHIDKGWSDIGYNVVIRRSGKIDIGRPLDAVGAHVKGFNSRSVGVCLIGGVNEAGEPDANYSPEQYDALELTIRFLQATYPQALVQGHRDFPDVNKACPCFDVREWLLDRGI